MILEIDVGNTRAKWRVLRGIEPAVVQSVAADELISGRFRPETGQISRVRVASVRGSAEEESIRRWSTQELGLVPEFARSTACVAGVRNGYEVPAKLGVDRWLAVIAAYCRYRCAVIVIDVGSAITADLVGDDGRHFGGHIAPGYGLMARSLLSGTEGVRFGRLSDSASTAPGTSTQSAVTGGLHAMVSGGLERIVRDWREAVPGARVVLTGGDAPSVLDTVAFAADHVPDLVLDGLQIALP